MTEETSLPSVPRPPPAWRTQVLLHVESTLLWLEAPPNFPVNRSSTVVQKETSATNDRTSTHWFLMSARKSIVFTSAKWIFPAASVRCASRDRAQPPSGLGKSLECAPAQLPDWFSVSDSVPADAHRIA